MIGFEEWCTQNDFKLLIYEESLNRVWIKGKDMDAESSACLAYRVTAHS